VWCQRLGLAHGTCPKQRLCTTTDATTTPKVEAGWKTPDQPLEELLKRRNFFFPAFSSYGGISGLFDEGPLGALLKEEVLKRWREKFLIAEPNMMLIQSPCITSRAVLKSSGHEDKFCDLMVFDRETGSPIRADQLMKQHLSQLINERRQGKAQGCDLSVDELESLLLRCSSGDLQTAEGAHELESWMKRLNVVNPETGNAVTEPHPFNLMFPVQVGPLLGGSEDGSSKGEATTTTTSTQVSHNAFLRPETAQGIFLNFPRLFQEANGRLPFGCAQIGQAFRNEISPRHGLLRTREFTMAEIEFFSDDPKIHPLFSQISSLSVPLFSALDQQSLLPSPTHSLIPP